MFQQTIKKSISLNGIGLHSGKKVSLTFKPADENTGIIFVRSDLKDCPKIKVASENISYRMRCTSLVTSHAEVHTTEHLLATCFALGITNLILEINGPEVPGCDGSASDFCKILDEAEIIRQKCEVSPVIVKKEIHLEDKNATIKALPYSNGLKLEYQLDYNVPFLKPQHVAFETKKETFEKEIAPARTFALKQEVDYLLKLGLGKGANLQNTLVIDENGNVVENELRFPDEFARHKLLDLLGDISLTGKPIQGHIIAKRSGHSLNAKLVKQLCS